MCKLIFIDGGKFGQGRVGEQKTIFSYNAYVFLKYSEHRQTTERNYFMWKQQIFIHLRFNYNDFRKHSFSI